jgi:hypothetical protein
MGTHKKQEGGDETPKVSYTLIRLFGALIIVYVILSSIFPRLPVTFQAFSFFLLGSLLLLYPRATTYLKYIAKVKIGNFELETTVYSLTKEADANNQKLLLEVTDQQVKDRITSEVEEEISAEVGSTGMLFRTNVLMEDEIRKIYVFYFPEKPIHTISTSTMVRDLALKGVLDLETLNSVHDFLPVRNQVVDPSNKISPKDVGAVINLGKKIITNIKLSQEKKRQEKKKAGY